MKFEIKKTRTPILIGLLGIPFLILVAFLTNELLNSNPLSAEPLAQTDEQIVQQFFPQRLIDESGDDFAKGGPPPFQTFDFAAADLNGTGNADFIVAVYSNGFSGVIRVLQKQNDAFQLVDEPDIPSMGGDFPEVRLLDLNNDERPEVIASFASARGPTEDWVFKWDGTELSLFGPTEIDALGITHTLLSDASFIDLNGDGVVEIINPKTDTFDIFTLEGDHYAFSREVVLELVDVDIKAGSDPNSINCSAQNKVIAVAILTTDDFDATTIDDTTVVFEGASETHVDKKSGDPRRHEEDVDGDGDIDLVFHLLLGDTRLGCDSTEGSLAGETFDGQVIVGGDVVRMVNDLP